MFINLLNRGFNLSVPAEEETLYIDAYSAFKERFQNYRTKDKGQKYDDFEALALAAIDSMVALQRNEERLNLLIENMKHRVLELDKTVGSGV